MPVIYVPDDAAIECQLLQDIINLTMNTEVPADASLAAQLLKEIRDGLAYVPFKKTFSIAEIMEAGDFDVDECPELPEGQAWEVICASACVKDQTIGYDGEPTIGITAEGAPRYQFQDSIAGLLNQGGDNFEKMAPYDTDNGPQTNFIESGKLIINLSSPSTLGNGTLTVYGLARKITL
jgi:hypothetical protein